MKFAIYGTQFNNSVLPFVQQLFDCLTQQRLQVCIYGEYSRFLQDKITFSKKQATFNNYQDLLAEGADVMISLGGDGTLLDTVSLVRDSQIPIIGINFGRLGFLASVNKNDIPSAIDSLVSKDFTLDNRALLRVESDSKLFGDENFALNDVTIHRRDTSAMMIIHAYLNDKFLNSYWADGLILATPTGSTAYSLSCGGPIIFPQSNNFVVTPISPHNLNVRPIVLADSNTVSFEIEGRSLKYLLSCDSRTEVLDAKSARITVKKSDFEINLIRLNTEDYLSTLRKKLLWGIDTRNY